MYYFKNKEFTTEANLELYLISEYWNKQNKNKLDITNSNDIKNILGNKKTIAYSLGKKDIGFFAFYYLTNNFVPSDDNSLRDLDKVHLEIFEELNKIFIDDETDKQEFILPRGLGKSTVINKLLGAWCHCYKYSRYTVVVGKREEDAVGFIDSTKEFLKLKKVIDTFGELVKKNSKRVVNKQELELENNTKLMAISSGSSMRGTTYACEEGVFRPAIIIVDDFINESDILSDEAKAKIVNKYYNEILETGDKAVVRKGKKVKMATKFLVIGTPLASDDFISTIRNDATFKVFHRSVVNFDIDKYFEENECWQIYKKILMNSKDDNRLKNAEEYYYRNIVEMKFDTVWNDKYKPLELANTYFTKRLSFMQELMCDCEKVGEIWITNIAQMKAEQIENNYKFNKTILTIDQSASNKSKSDFTAMTILSESNGFYFVREGSLYKFDSEIEFDKYIATVIDKLTLWRDITHIRLEKNVYKGVDATRIEEAIKKIPELRNREIVVETIYNTKNKDSRIMTITQKINSGTVIFNEDNKEYNKQIKDFRGQKFSLHDDAIDSLEMAINNIDKIKIKKQRICVFLKRDALF